jgi:osmotically-inducible protein OsmY
MTAAGRWLACLVLAGAILAGAGCLTPIDPNEDRRIEAEVKARLVAEKAANLTRLGVVSSEGTVYLSGSVVSSIQKTRAEAITKQVKGVTRVVNALDVRATNE